MLVLHLAHTDICPAETTTLMISNTTYSWPVTEQGVTKLQPCPSQSESSANASVTRYCGVSDSGGIMWSDVNYSQCSEWVSILSNSMQRLKYGYHIDG